MAKFISSFLRKAESVPRDDQQQKPSQKRDARDTEVGRAESVGEGMELGVTAQGCTPGSAGPAQHKGTLGLGGGLGKRTRRETEAEEQRDNF